MRPNFSDGKTKIISSEKTKNIRIVWRFGYFRVISNVNENKKKKKQSKNILLFFQLFVEIILILQPILKKLGEEAYKMCSRTTSRRCFKIFCLPKTRYYH